MATYRELIVATTERLRKAGVPEPGVDARLLVRHAAGLAAEKLLASLPDDVPMSTVDALEPLVIRREKREPLQYIIGKAEFYGREFTVDSRVLVPRPETEQIVEQAIGFVQKTGLGKPRIIDIGTGSGILAITLALELPKADVWATDVSAAALGVARSNVESLGAKVNFIEGDLIGPLESRFDVIVSNPPYILSSAMAELEPELSWEPHGALDGGADGLAVIRPLIGALASFLTEDESIALVEIDPPVAEESARMARESVAGARVDVLTDLAGLERVLVVARG